MQEPRVRILLVDDDETNTQVYARCLRGAGYEVTALNNARKAIELLVPGAFEVLVTDMLMPEVDGIEIIQHARKLSPRPAIVPMSGGGAYLTASQMLSYAVKLGGLAPLVKPFTSDRLLSAVASVLKD